MKIYYSTKTLTLLSSFNVNASPLLPFPPSADAKTTNGRSFRSNVSQGPVPGLSANIPAIGRVKTASDAPTGTPDQKTW